MCIKYRQYSHLYYTIYFLYSLHISHNLSNSYIHFHIIITTFFFFFFNSPYHEWTLFHHCHRYFHYFHLSYPTTLTSVDSRLGATMLKENEINAVTSLLKQYFRELPEALFTDALYPRLMEEYGLYPS